MSPRLAFAIETAFRAGKSTLAHFQTGTEVITKSDKSPVTIADRNAERMIREAIAETYPNEKILGEEEGGDDTPDRWIIDPIDGTKSFICGVPLYSTLLSYEQNGRPIVGVCYFPALDQMYTAEIGGGAFCNGRAIQVSAKTKVEGSVVSSGGHSSMAKYGRAPGLEAIASKALATRTWADAYGHALVASGFIEAMTDPIVSRWDISAMELIVKEAGGKCTRFDGTDPLKADNNGRYEMVSSNGLVHDELLEYFR
ncbi:histidinol-phosphatase [soil metagenome]